MAFICPICGSEVPTEKTERADGQLMCSACAKDPSRVASDPMATDPVRGGTAVTLIGWMQANKPMAIGVVAVATVLLLVLVVRPGSQPSGAPAQQPPATLPAQSPESGEPEGEEVPATAPEVLGLTEAQQVWSVEGYVPSNRTYMVGIVGRTFELLDKGGAQAYLSDDGETVYTSYPAALKASDGTALWEGSEAEENSIALAGDGVYTLDPLARLWPSPAPARLADVLGRTAFHTFDGAGLGWPDVDRPEIQKVRPKAKWDVHALKTDPSGRWWLFFERTLSPKPGQRESVPGEWEFMVYDAESHRVAYTRPTSGIGWVPIVPDSTPDDTDSDGGRILVLIDGRFVAGNVIAGEDSSKDLTILSGEPQVRDKGVGQVEGSPNLVMVGLEVDSSAPDELKSETPDWICVDVNSGNKYMLPEGLHVLSGSRDGRRVLVGSNEGPIGVALYELP